MKMARKCGFTWPLSLRGEERGPLFLRLVMEKPPKSRSITKPACLFFDRNQGAPSDFLRMKTAFLNLLVGSGASDSISKTELLQTEAISSRIFRLTHGHSSPHRSNVSGKGQFR